MSEKSAFARAQEAGHEGKSPFTQAGEFVREEIENIRKGEHGARSTKQAIAIGLSRARRAGVELPAPKRGTVPERTRVKAKQDLAKVGEPKSAKRSAATKKALRREGRSAVSKKALADHARLSARKRTAAKRSAAAKEAAKTRMKVAHEKTPVNAGA
jgi:Family of unknown function (DUF6496)